MIYCPQPEHMDLTARYKPDTLGIVSIVPLLFLYCSSIVPLLLAVFLLPWI
jgi:hypothetical protein